MTKVYTHQPRVPTPDSRPRLPQGVVAIPPVSNQHTMTTRAKSGYRILARPIEPALHAAALSPKLKTYRSALADPNWQVAMVEEHDALL